MVVMNVKINNLLLFRDFELKMSYPKKIVGSTISEECLSERPNFRYKKLIVLMGPNATGKTALGKVLMGIFNFIVRKNADHVTKLIDDNTKEASFEIDLAFPTNELYRITALIHVPQNEKHEYSLKDICVQVRAESIVKMDNYERCAERIASEEPFAADSYIEALEMVPPLTWNFEYPYASDGKQRAIDPIDQKSYGKALEKTLQALDPRIQKVTMIPNSKNTYVIHKEHDEILMKDGRILEPEKLSSGTIEGIGIADIVSSMSLGAYAFYYCDEKFSHIHSDLEKAFLSLFVELLGPNEQMIITSHNSDILDMNLPKHTYAFLRRNTEDNSVSCVYASDYLKKNTESLKNAVENDLFSSAPDLQKIYEIEEMYAV